MLAYPGYDVGFLGVCGLPIEIDPRNRRSLAMALVVGAFWT